MSGEERRQAIVKYLQKSTEPVSGTQLAKEFGVSRQVIVQDIALLRAGECEIDSTPKGYLCRRKKEAVRIFAVCHTDEEILEELNLIVDCGGAAADVFVQHDVYGELRAELNLRSRRQVEEFVEDIHSGKSSPLKNITSGNHFHTVTAESEQILDEIENELKMRGFLVSEKLK